MKFDFSSFIWLKGKFNIKKFNIIDLYRAIHRNKKNYTFEFHEYFCMFYASQHTKLISSIKLVTQNVKSTNKKWFFYIFWCSQLVICWWMIIFLVVALEIIYIFLHVNRLAIAIARFPSNSHGSLIKSLHISHLVIVDLIASNVNKICEFYKYKYETFHKLW